MTTIRDVAKLADVSVATVSRVLNGSSKVSSKSREAVLAAQRELGFYLNANAKALAKRESKTVGVVVSDVSDPYFGAMIRECENTVYTAGCNMLVGQGYHNVQRERQAINALLSYQCRALVVHALAMTDDELADYMDRIPYMVLVNRVLKGYEFRCFNCDNRKGEFLAVRELIENGHTKIAYIGSKHKIPDSRERLDGYTDALREAGIPFRKELCSAGDPSLEGGGQAARGLLKSARPGVDFTAVACYSDVMAAGVMAVLHESGLSVPEDISVTGFDNLFLSRCLIPRLTTIENPVCQMASSAVKCSMELYAGEDPTENSLLDVALVKGHSVKNIKEERA